MLASHCQQCRRMFNPTPTGQKNILDMPIDHLESCKIPVLKNVTKTAHHVHHIKEKNFIASLCSKCNLSIQSRYQTVPIFCHNFSRFDHIFILKGICRLWNKSKIDILSKSEAFLLSKKMSFAHTIVKMWMESFFTEEPEASSVSSSASSSSQPAAG